MSKSNQKNIGPIANLSAFIQKYPNQKLHDQMKLLEQSFPSHRAVKGDGNCFYRAFAFLYLASSKCQTFLTTFPKTEFNYKKKDSNIQSNDQFQETLYSMWNKYISKLPELQTQEKKEKKLEKIFNQIRLFDEILIGYFRSLNFSHMLKNRSMLRPFLRDDLNFQAELSRVKTFDSQSEQIQIYSIADALDIKITVFYIDENTFQPIQYNERMPDQGIYLFFRPGHYDIIYPFYKNDTVSPSASASNHEKTKSLIQMFKKQTNHPLNKQSFKQKQEQKQAEEKMIKESIKQQPSQKESSVKQKKTTEKTQILHTRSINKPKTFGNDSRFDVKYNASPQNPKIKSATTYQPRIIGKQNPLNRCYIELLGICALLIIFFFVSSA